MAHDSHRIVRIGSHTGEGQLRARLYQHFSSPNKDRSIFRKNIGRALLNHRKDPFLEIWELDLTSKAARDRYSQLIDFEKQESVEREVSDVIQSNFFFVVCEIADMDQRLGLERKMISTASLCRDCKPSKNWLGTWSPKLKIRESGLWQVNHLYKQPLSDKDLSLLGAKSNHQAVLDKKELRLRVDEVLYYVRDRIGVSDEPYARGEYRGYVQELSMLVEENESVNPIPSRLARIVRERMGLSPNLRQCDYAAEILLLHMRAIRGGYS